MESIQITNSSLWLGLTVWLKLIWFFKSQTMIWFQPIISCLDMFWTRTSDVWLLRFKTISLAVDPYVVLCCVLNVHDVTCSNAEKLTSLTSGKRQSNITLHFGFSFLLYSSYLFLFILLSYHMFICYMSKMMMRNGNLLWNFHKIFRKFLIKL